MGHRVWAARFMTYGAEKGQSVPDLFSIRMPNDHNLMVRREGDGKKSAKRGDV